MKGRQINPAFFAKDKSKDASSNSLNVKLKNARASGSLNLSSLMPPMESIPLEIFSLHNNLEPGEKIWEFEPLKQLDFSFNKIRVLPADIGKLMDCLSMKFRDNSISSIADELFTGCLSLRHLDLGKNQLCSLSESIGNLVQLREIILSDNRLELIPDTLFQLANLRQLEIQNNGIKSLGRGENWNLPVVAVLDLSGNKLSFLPAAISTMRSLEVFNCSKNNLSNVPDLSQLSSLRMLDISQNGLSFFPTLPVAAATLSMSHQQQQQRAAVLQSASALTHLVLSYNRIRDIPVNDLVHHKALCEILLHNNCISYIPETIEMLSALKVFDISNNEIRDLPASLGWMSALQRLKVDGNPMKAIRQTLLVKPSNELKAYLRTRGPSILGHEEYSEVSANQLKPTGVAAITSLVGNSSFSARATDGPIINRIRDISAGTLDLSSLALSSLPPSTLDSVLSVPVGSTLTSINLTDNSFSIFPIDSRWYNEIPTLKHLNMKGNKLNELAMNNFPSYFMPLVSLDLSSNKIAGEAMCDILTTMNLTTLEINNNPLLSIPRSLSLHSNLTVLRAAYCGILTLDDFDFSCTPQLQVLDVSNNKIASISKRLFLAENLEYLSVENNNITDIPFEISRLRVLKTFLLMGNPQRTVRSNVLQQGSAKVIEYLRNRFQQDGAQPLQRSNKHEPVSRGGNGSNSDVNSISTSDVFARATVAKAVGGSFVNHSDISANRAQLTSGFHTHDDDDEYHKPCSIPPRTRCEVPDPVPPPSAVASYPQSVARHNQPLSHAQGTYGGHTSNNEIYYNHHDRTERDNSEGGGSFGGSGSRYKYEASAQPQPVQQQQSRGSSGFANDGTSWGTNTSRSQHIATNTSSGGRATTTSNNNNNNNNGSGSTFNGTVSNNRRGVASTTSTRPW